MLETAQDIVDQAARAIDTPAAYVAAQHQGLSRTFDHGSEGAGVRAARAIAQYLDAERQSASRRKDSRVSLELAHG